MISFNEIDNFGLSVEGVPYYAIKLTAEQAEKVKNRKLMFYETDGKTLFDIKNSKNVPTGEKMLFILFM